MKIVVLDIYNKLTYSILNNKRYHTINYLLYLEKMKISKEGKLICKLINKRKYVV